MLPEEIAGSPFGLRLQAALVTLTAAYRVSRRGITEIARDLFGVNLSTGAADAICQRASQALAGPHLQLQDFVLGQPAVHVDETGWRTSGDGRALWGASTPDAVFLQIAEHCNRAVFNALIGTGYPGIVISDRWNGYNHLDPNQRQACWSHIQRDFRKHADGLAEQKTFGEQGVRLTKQVFAAWRAYQHEHHDRRQLQAEIAPIQEQLRQLLETASAKKARNRWHRGFANNLLKIWPALWTFTLIDGIEPTNNPAERALRAPVIHRKVSLGTKATTASGSPNAHCPPPAPADCNTTRCSPTSANRSPLTLAATHSPPSPPDAPGTERLHLLIRWSQVRVLPGHGRMPANQGLMRVRHQSVRLACPQIPRSAYDLHVSRRSGSSLRSRPTRNAPSSQQVAERSVREWKC